MEEARSLGDRPPPACPNRMAGVHKQVETRNTSEPHLAGLRYGERKEREGPERRREPWRPPP